MYGWPRLLPLWPVQFAQESIPELWVLDVPSIGASDLTMIYYAITEELVGAKRIVRSLCQSRVSLALSQDAGGWLEEGGDSVPGLPSTSFDEKQVRGFAKSRHSRLYGSDLDAFPCSSTRNVCSLT